MRHKMNSTAISLLSATCGSRVTTVSFSIDSIPELMEDPVALETEPLDKGVPSHVTACRSYQENSVLRIDGKQCSATDPKAVNN